MNIENLTFGEMKQIAAIVNGCGLVKGESFQPLTESTQHPFVGKFVIARCYSAGVHAGIVVNVDGDTAILKDSRRLWSWKAKDGLALSGVAQNGIESNSKVDVVNPEIYLTGICELIPASSVAQATIYGN
jgi:hypothetical protein